MAVTDNFNRANGGLGANWTTAGGFSALAIVSNACQGGTSGQHCVGFYTTGGTIAADQYAQVKVTNTAGFIGPVLRGDGVNTFYVCYYNAGTASIYKWIGASPTQIGSGSTITPAVNDVIYFEAVGSALTFKVNGVTVCTATDSSITGAGYTGINIYDNVGAVDDFEGGVAGAVTVTVNLTGVSASPAVGTLGFNVSLPLAGVAAMPVIGTGTVTIGGVVVEPPPVGPSGGTGRSGMRLRPTEDIRLYLEGVAANPRVGRGALRSDLDRLSEAYSLPIQRAEARKPAQMPPGMRRLFKPVEKPIPPAVFVYQVGLPKLRSSVGRGTVTAHFEDIDEELVGLLDAL